MKRLMKALKRLLKRWTDLMDALVEFIFQNVPRDYAKFPVTGFIFTGETYTVDGVLYEELAHVDQPGLRIILDVNANRIIRVVAGNRALVL